MYPAFGLHSYAGGVQVDAVRIYCVATTTGGDAFVTYAALLPHVYTDGAHSQPHRPLSTGLLE